MQVQIFMIPRNHEYIRRLKGYLEKKEVCVKLLKPFHYSSFSNLINILSFRMAGYRVIHVHWLYIFPFSLLMKLFYFLCRGLGIKIVWEVHNIVQHENTERDKKNSKWFFDRVDAVIFHSPGDASRMREMTGSYGPRQHIVVPHGNFNDSYEDTISRDRARALLQLPDEKKVILCFGFIRRNRGYEYLLEATKEMKDITVLIAGKVQDTDVYEKLKKHADRSANLRLHTGWIPDDRIQVYFKASDVVVLPYTHITTSGVIPLAYAFRRPVISTSIGGIRDIVTAETGILVPPRDSATLRNAITEILKMDCEIMGRRGFEFARTYMDWNANAEKMKQLYQRFLFKDADSSSQAVFKNK